MTETKPGRDPYVYEGLGLTAERAEELVELIYDEMESDHSITDSIKRIQYDHAKSEGERNFMLFTFGYNVRELDMRNDIAELIEGILDNETGLDEETGDMTSDMVNVMMTITEYPVDFFRDVA